MKTTIILSLDTRKPKKDGTFPIILRLTHFRKTTAIGTGYYLDQKFWDENKKEVRKTYLGVTSVARFNNVLSKLLADARSAIVSLEEKQELGGLSITELRAKLNPANKSTSLTEFVLAHIKYLQEMQRFGNARTYDNMLKSIQNYCNKKEIGFNEINAGFVKSFETAYLKKGNSHNSLASIFKSLKAIINKAIKEGKVDKDRSPFSQYKIKWTPTAKRALSGELISRIICCKLEETHPCFEARNIFLLSYYLWGINVIDLAYLKGSNIVDGRLKFVRHKTQKPFDIKIPPIASSILDYYLKDKDRNAFILPILKRNTPFEQDKDILGFRKKFNKSLKELANLCEIETNLTSYVARHSFASNAESLEIPIQAISKMLGHANVTVTEIYLKGFSKDSIDAYHERLLASLE